MSTEIETPFDWLGYRGYGEAVMRLQAQEYVRCCHTIALLPWWKRMGMQCELVPGYHGARDMLRLHCSDYMTTEIQWVHRLAFPRAHRIR